MSSEHTAPHYLQYKIAMAVSLHFIYYYELIYLIRSSGEKQFLKKIEFS